MDAEIYADLFTMIYIRITKRLGGATLLPDSIWVARSITAWLNSKTADKISGLICQELHMANLLTTILHPESRGFLMEAHNPKPEFLILVILIQRKTNLIHAIL